MTEKLQNHRSRINHKTIILKNELSKCGYAARTIWDSTKSFFFDDIIAQVDKCYEQILAEYDLRKSIIIPQDFFNKIKNEVDPLVGIYIDQLNFFNQGNMLESFQICEKDIQNFKENIEMHLMNHIYILQAKYNRQLEEKETIRKTLIYARSSRTAAWIAVITTILFGLMQFKTINDWAVNSAEPTITALNNFYVLQHISVIIGKNIAEVTSPVIEKISGNVIRVSFAQPSHEKVTNAILPEEKTIS